MATVGVVYDGGFWEFRERRPVMPGVGASLPAGNAEQIAPPSPHFKVISMSTRFALVLVCLVALVLVPLAGCTPPASEDVQFIGGSVTDGGSCCPASTSLDGDLAIVLPGTTASL